MGRLGEGGDRWRGKEGQVRSHVSRGSLLYIRLTRQIVYAARGFRTVARVVARQDGKARSSPPEPFARSRACAFPAIEPLAASQAKPSLPSSTRLLSLSFFIRISLP